MRSQGKPLLPSQQSARTGSSSFSVIRVLSRILTYMTIIMLLVACITLSILLKGAKQAHHELWEELMQQENKTANVYQEMASDKVVLVEQEDKANSASREKTFLEQELKWVKEELENQKEYVSHVNAQLDDLNKREAECREEVKTKTKNNQLIVSDLKALKSQHDALKRKNANAVKMIDTLTKKLEEQVGVDESIVDEDEVAGEKDNKVVQQMQVTTKTPAEIAKEKRAASKDEFTGDSSKPKKSSSKAEHSGDNEDNLENLDSELDIETEGDAYYIDNHEQL